MADTGAAPFEAASNDAAVGSVAWSNPSNAISSGGGYATAIVELNTTNYLKFLTCSANYTPIQPPTGSTIDGIEVSVIRSMAGGGGSITDSTVKLVKAGVVVGSNRASATVWPGSDTGESYGSSSDLWGTTWTAEEVNDSDFGFVLSAVEGNEISVTARVDYAALTVYYTDPGGGSGVAFLLVA